MEDKTIETPPPRYWDSGVDPTPERHGIGFQVGPWYVRRRSVDPFFYRYGLDDGVMVGALIALVLAFGALAIALFTHFTN